MFGGSKKDKKQDKKEDEDKNLPTVPVTELKPDEIYDCFCLKPGGDGKVFELAPNESHNVPDHLSKLGFRNFSG